MASDASLTTTIDVLKDLQNFDPKTLSRDADLGLLMNFSNAVEYAEAIVDMYKKIPVAALSDFTDSQLNVIQDQAAEDLNLFDHILKFDSTSPNSANTRASILARIKERRDILFEHLWQYVAYGVARITTIEQINKLKTDGESVLEKIKSTAAELGVSQRATYFKDEVNTQEDSAQRWLLCASISAITLVFFAIFSLFLHKFDLIRPANTTEMLQLMTSKVLIFSVLGYILILAAKNYTAHKHNAVVNRHRQNALLTYRSLSAAADDAGTQDIVLAHAASCIFSPQETGFTSGKNDATSGSKSVLELLTRGSARAAG